MQCHGHDITPMLFLVEESENSKGSHILCFAENLIKHVQTSSVVEFCIHSPQFVQVSSQNSSKCHSCFRRRHGFLRLVN